MGIFSSSSNTCNPFSSNVTRDVHPSRRGREHDAGNASGSAVLTPEVRGGLQMRNRVHFPLMALGLLALLTALWGGLVRLGWPWPVPQPSLWPMGR